VSFFLHNVIAFGRLLRGQGLPVDTGRLIDATAALQHIDLSLRGDVHATLRALLVQRHEDLAVFDRVFDEFWMARPGTSAKTSNPPRTAAPRELEAPQAHEAHQAPQAPDPPEALQVLGAWSDAESIANKDFGALTASELAIVRSALGRLAWDVAERRTRRWVPGRGSRIDVRRALARSLRTGGDITMLPRRRRRTRPRPIVLLCDVSGSMERYTRTLLLFAHTLSRGKRGVEAFLFATTLTRITMELRTPTPDAAMAAVSRAVRDWSGGTRIGEALRTFHQRWRRRTLPSRAVVLVISDGWDRGDPQVLREQIARLQRSCHRLVWLNPLIGTTDYAPLTRGLAAALPFVDDFLPVRTLRDVRDLAIHLGEIPRHGRHRHLHLRRAARTGLDTDAGPGGDRVVHPGL
jgi:uncharacterized protein with von Willebrand factor type A (vWA) domain